MAIWIWFTYKYQAVKFDRKDKLSFYHSQLSAHWLHRHVHRNEFFALALTLERTSPHLVMLPKRSHAHRHTPSARLEFCHLWLDEADDVIIARRRRVTVCASHSTAMPLSRRSWRFSFMPACHVLHSIVTHPSDRCYRHTMTSSNAGASHELARDWLSFCLFVCTAVRAGVFHALSLLASRHSFIF